MLTRSEKKRTAGKDESCPPNSKFKYSTVPHNEAVEVGEMVTTDHGGTSGGLGDDGQRTDYLQVAWLLREKLNDLVDGDKGEGLALRSLLDMASSRNIVSVDPKMLNPVLWRTLPKELLLLVLARLPLPDITRLRCLSREWRKDMATANSEIQQACHEASPAMVALLLLNDEGYCVEIYDIKKCSEQYAYQLHLYDDSEKWPLIRNAKCRQAWTAVDACDGGLVCFISLWKPTKRNQLCIVVVNLLTRVQHELPPLHYLYFALPTMVQIKMDSHTKCYQVVVACYKRGGLTIEIYDSSTREWTKATPPCGFIFGYVHKWTNINGWYYRLSSKTPGAYDFTEGKLTLYKKDNPSTQAFVISSVLEKDCMFVLLEQTHPGRIHRDFSITEYHFENLTKAWVQWKSYECPTFEATKRDSFGLYLVACDGFLMVHYDWRYQYYWLLDLSTSKWSHLPKPIIQYTVQFLLCKASWNVIP